ncbi:hypothetical protein D3C79_754840 [compost metagenome]
MLVDGQHRLVPEQRHVSDTRQGHRVGSHHKVEVPPLQGRQRCERQPRRQVQFNFRPGAAKLVQRGHQPLIAAVALDRDVQPVGRAASQLAQVALRGADQWQHLVGQLQQLETRSGETYRFGLAHKHGHANAGFQLPELVR